MDLARMAPHGESASTGFCLADPGREYLVYAPSGGPIEVDLTRVSGELAVEWFDPRTGDVVHGSKARGGSRREFAPPFSADAVLYLAITSD